jgi:hypothetical protein
MRAREYKQDLVAKHGGGQLSIMQVGMHVGWEDTSNQLLQFQPRMGKRMGASGHACQCLSAMCLVLGS